MHVLYWIYSFVSTSYLTLAGFLFSGFAQAVINCGLVSENLAPCLAFLESGQGPSAACCNGVKTLKTMAATVQDRRTACRCMKSTAAAIPGISQKYTAALPSKCGVSLPGAVGPQTDCNQYASF